jgi:hypothetical protein
MEAIIVIILLSIIIIIFAVQHNKSQKIKRIRAMYHHELGQAQRFIDDANRMKNLDPILERIDLSIGCIGRAKDYTTNAEEENYVPKLLGELMEARQKVIIDHYKEKAKNLIEKTTTQVTIKTKLNTLNKALELSNEMNLKYPEFSAISQKLRSRTNSYMVKLAFEDFNEKAEKQEFLGKNTLAEKTWQEALWFINKSDITPVEKDKYTTEIKYKLKQLGA